MLDQDVSDMVEVQAGRLERFAGIVARHQSGLVRYAQSKLGSRALAEDAVQETLMAAYQARHSFDPTKNFRGWLWAILVNTCRRLGKREFRLTDLRISLLDHDAVCDCIGVDEELSVQEDRRKLAELLEQLPDIQADALRMRFFGELTFDEIGEVTSCSASTAKSRVRYAIAKLAELMRAGQEISR